VNRYYKIFGIGGIVLLVYLLSPIFSEQGEANARKYCGGCHLFPEPNLLDKKTWAESVLPNMGSRLGVVTEGYDPYEFLDSVDLDFVKSQKIYPEQALISKRVWRSILKYYERLAPDHLEIEEGLMDNTSRAPFTSQLLNIGDQQIPRVSLLEYAQESGSIFIGDNNSLYEISKRLQVINSWNINSPASDMARLEGNDYLMLVGSIKPTDQKQGVFFPLKVQNQSTALDLVLDSLARPVNFAFGDLNSDGQNDLVVCSFGNITGSLSWYENSGKEHVLVNLPGARKVELVDLDTDGDLDIISLMSQAWESIDVFLNDGAGKFKRQKLLSFQPLHGTSYFELADFNGDGHRDLLVTNGDNWDYSDVLKPYHGVRVFLNDGKMNFQEEFFFQMPGCSKAIARDFDNDGDLDIVACAFFSARDKSTNSLIYLEGSGALTFEAKQMMDENLGEWLTMEVVDINEDNKLDILLGSYYHNFQEFQKALLSGSGVFPQVMILKHD
jgi:hypothetical protein